MSITVNKTRLPGSVIKTASGAVASVSDARMRGAIGVEASFEPRQDLHGYDSPWPAGGGKNLCNPSELSLSGNLVWGYYSTGFLFEAGKTYTFSVSNSVAPGSISIYATDHSTQLAYSNANYVVYAPSENTYGCLRVYKNGIALDTIKASAQLEISSTATSFAPYSNFCPISGITEASAWGSGTNLVNINGAVYSTNKNPADPVNLADYGVIRSFSANGYIRPNNISDFSIENRTITFTTLSSAYGVGLVAKAIPGQKYTYKTIHGSNASTVTTVIGYYKSDCTFISSIAIGNAQTYTFTVPDGVDYIIVVLRGGSQGSTYTFTDCQLQLGETASTYEEYKGLRSVTAQLGEERFGGTYDFVRGNLTLTMGYELIDYSRIGVSTTIYTYVPAGGMKSGNNVRGICDGFATVTGSHLFGVRFGANNSTLYLYRLNEFVPGISDLQTCRQYFANNPTYICYELATPIVIDMTPAEFRLFHRQNYVWSDVGDTKLTYAAIREHGG